MKIFYCRCQWYCNRSLLRLHGIDRIVTLAEIENSATMLRFFDSTGNNYATKISPSDLNFDLYDDIGTVLEKRNVQFKSLVKGTGGTFYAHAVSYTHYKDLMFGGGQFYDRKEEYVYKYSANGYIEKIILLPHHGTRYEDRPSPVLFSDLQPVNGLIIGAGVRLSSDSLVAVDRDLNPLSGYGFPVTMPPLDYDYIHTADYSYVRQFRFHQNGEIYNFVRHGTFYQKYDFQGNKNWSSNDPSSIILNSIQRIQNIIPVGNKEFILEGYDLNNRMTVLKLREKGITPAIVEAGSKPKMPGQDFRLINKMRTGEPKIFPNPSKDWINISVPDAYIGSGILTINDYSGRLLRSQKLQINATTRLNVSSLIPGYYLLTINNGKGDRWQEFFIKQ
jgi:hypothetical protein